MPLDELRGMYERGELAAGALVARVGADAWEPVEAVLGKRFPGPPAVAPPVRPMGEIGGQQDAFFPVAGWAFGLGLASWVCSLSVLTGIPAIICGHMALSRIKAERNSNNTAKVLAIIGLVLGYLSLAGAVVFALFFGVAVLGALAGAGGP